MGKIKKSTLFGLIFLLLFVAGCKVSCTTANISSLKFSKDEKGTVEAKEFAPNDTIYARASVSNNGSKVTLKFSLVAEKVEGTKENTPVPSADVSVDVQGDAYGVYNLHRDGGWPPGRYRVEVAMLYSGEQKDKKSDTFTVTGGGSGGVPPASTVPPTSAEPPSHPENDTQEEDENGSENSNTHGEH